ncbi:hypothetical protein H7J77_05485 [Mycolicibacillus parakoreensis]|uniref:ABC-type glycine betaine transport system substrate-binding domain-containing protein n=1 Tax=Mycolicibacillus parakoreensis TaxID=1069221 RepID=A0ABY3U4I5_9MYCO|nr:glycine betaine ABC transporter substrate-binding protein [Mycolicibacillus parakoreensis]MCV7314988.1 hypothetical protein [Mycolicibacillus parakoreensis]ULN53646.1 hypothetical protein MIU77_04800 [Mycolicibacillus parakoreensis]
MSALRVLATAMLVVLAVGCTRPASAPPLAVGATVDTLGRVVAHVYAAALRSAGSPGQVVIVDDPIGELSSGTVTVAPGFTGRLLRLFQPEATVRSDKQVYRTMVAALPEGITAGDYATAAEDKPALAVTEATAERWGDSDLAAAVRHCGALTAVGAVTGTRTPATVGSCRLPTAQEFSSDTVLFAALRQGELTAAWTSTADTGLPEEVTVLADTTPARVQAENVVPLYRRHVLAEHQVLALNQVAGVLDTAALVEMVQQVDVGTDPRAAAEDWLAEHPLGR